MAYIDENGRVHRDAPPATRSTSSTSSGIGSDGRYTRSGTASSSTSTSSSTYTSGYSTTSTGGIVTGIIFAVIFVVALIVGLNASHLEGINSLIKLPDYLFFGFGWIYWIAVGLVVAISTITIIAKEDFVQGIWTFLATSVANITALLGAVIYTALLRPIIYQWHVGDGTVADFMGIKTFNLEGVIHTILEYAPHIFLGAVLFSSFIFIINRYSSQYEIELLDILWSFFCTIIVGVSTVAAACAAVALGWVIICMLFAVLMIVAAIIAFVCWCGGC